MTNPYEIDIDPTPTPIQLPSPLLMSEPQPSTSKHCEPTAEEVLAQAMSIMDQVGYDFQKKGIKSTDDLKGKSLLKEPPVFDRDKKKY